MVKLFVFAYKDSSVRHQHAALNVFKVLIAHKMRLVPIKNVLILVLELVEL